VIEGKKITLTIDGQSIEGEIVRLLPNDVTVRITNPPFDETKGLHVPHFMMGYKKHHLQDEKGKITPRGVEKAERLLAEIYLACRE
jgi:hypothetical protein